MSDVTKYRIITISSRILKMIVHSKLIRFMNKKLANFQQGIRSKRSIVTNLMNIIREGMLSFHKMYKLRAGKQTTVPIYNLLTNKECFVKIGDKQYKTSFGISVGKHTGVIAFPYMHK